MRGEEGDEKQIRRKKRKTKIMDHALPITHH